MAHSEQSIPYQPYPNSKSEAYLYGVHAASVQEGWSCSRHLHHMMLEINLVLDGTQTADIAGTRIVQQTGELVVVPPMRLHTFRAASPLRYFVLHIQIDDPAFLRQLGDSGLLLIGREDPLAPRLVRAVRDIRERLDRGDTRIGIYRLVYEILELLETEIRSRGLAAQAEPDALPLLIAREIETIVARPDAEGSIEQPELRDSWMEDIAGKLGYSRRHCYRAFKEAYRMSPREYLFVLRQQQAMHLLANTGLSLEEIAVRIGYDNVQSFIRQFAKWTGTTPGRFRKDKLDAPSYLTPIELA
ncbi:helix-turn-helix domain-containing protein [Cohnella sp. 56]|uniref:helix-turn-helix domain-containing protein n=1 Tax=Cohnella sp. 56 TaxID=3113722 RepID=UPI0030EA6100